MQFKDTFNDRDAHNYLEFKKDLIKKLKEFDKMYVKHTKKKGNHDFMDQEIHQISAAPLTKLCERNMNFH